MTTGMVDNSYLSEEKKEQILEAALGEFSQKGYAKASTNSIIQTAGVSKGLLFHYFGSKKLLYLSTLDRCIDYYETYFDQRIRQMPKDVIQRVIEINLIKLEIFKQRPWYHNLLLNAFLEPPEELSQEINLRQQKLSAKYMPLVIQDIDKSIFRRGIDPDRATELVLAITDSLSQKYIKMFRETRDPNNIDLTAFVRELDLYLGMVKYGIYEREDIHD